MALLKARAHEIDQDGFHFQEACSKRVGSIAPNECAWTNVYLLYAPIAWPLLAIYTGLAIASSLDRCDDASLWMDLTIRG
jgi:hypothetical protein